MGERLKSEPGIRSVALSGEGAGSAPASTSARSRPCGTASSSATGGPPAPGPAQAAGQRAAWVWAEIPVPVIAAVTGNALGGGLQITLGADIRIVAPDTKLSVLEIKWGLVPNMTGSQLLPELVGRDVAKELTFSGRVVTGTEAVALGLATGSTPSRTGPPTSWPGRSRAAARTPSGRPSGCLTWRAGWTWPWASPPSSGRSVP